MKTQEFNQPLGNNLQIHNMFFTMSIITASVTLLGFAITVASQTLNMHNW
jgi:hypothetical protein